MMANKEDWNKVVMAAKMVSDPWCLSTPSSLRRSQIGLSSGSEHACGSQRSMNSMCCVVAGARFALLCFIMLSSVLSESVNVRNVPDDASMKVHVL